MIIPHLFNRMSLGDHFGILRSASNFTVRLSDEPTINICESFFMMETYCVLYALLTI